VVSKPPKKIFLLAARTGCDRGAREGGRSSRIKRIKDVGDAGTKVLFLWGLGVNVGFGRGRRVGYRISYGEGNFGVS